MEAESYELRVRPGFGRFRVVAAGLTFREVVALIGSVPGKAVDYWLHNTSNKGADHGDVQDMRGEHHLGGSLPDAEASPPRRDTEREG